MKNLTNSRGLILIVLTLLLLASNKSAWACDACGCSSGGNFVGLLPQFNKKFIGLRVKHRGFAADGTAASHHTDGNNQPHQDAFTTYEAWFRFFPAKRIQAIVYLPYSVNRKTESGITQQIQGLGDATLSAHYVVYNSTDSLHLNFRQALLLGGGVKLPTGKYQQRDASKTAYFPNFQIGTGAYTYFAQAIYTIRYAKFGLNTESSYRHNAINELDYQFGRQWNVASTLFYNKQLRNAALIPNAGVFYEDIAIDKQYGALQAFTGSSVLMQTLGLEYYYQSWALSLNTQLPLWQKVPVGATSAGARFMFGLSYVF